MEYELNADLKNEIETLLEQGRKTDPDCQRFGAEKHQYKLNPVISKDELDEILESCQFRIPEDFYWFLTNVGNGGAGPFYGIYPFSLEKKSWHSLAHNPVTYVTQEECDAINEDDVSDDDYDAFYDKAFGGMIYLDHEGCSGMVCLIVQGEDFGKVIYMDDEFFGAPRFPTAIEPNTFINWYMGWLHEIALGYDARGYGFAVNGSVEQIYEKFLQETDNDERRYLLHGMEKGKGIEISQLMQPSGVDVLKLPENIIAGLKKTVLEDKCPEVSSAAAEVLMYYGCQGWKDAVRFQLKNHPLWSNWLLLYELKACYEFQFKYSPEVDEWYEDMLEVITRGLKNIDVNNEDMVSAFSIALGLVINAPKYRPDDIKEFFKYKEWEISEPLIRESSDHPYPKDWETIYFESTREQIDKFLHQKNHVKKDCNRLRSGLFTIRNVLKNGSEGCSQRYYEYIKDDLDSLRKYFQTNDLKDIDECIALNCEQAYKALGIELADK